MISELRNKNFVDSLNAKSERTTNSAAHISTSPAIVQMLMTPKSRDTKRPVSPLEHFRRMMPHQDANFGLMQKDINSPSAASRMRAIRALRSPNKVYNTFDVPHAEQSIITAEERNPVSQPTLSDILKDVIVFVEVRTGNDNRSEGVKSIISKLGAQVNDRFLRNTTHVVFKDGLLSTYKRAQSWNIPIVSILWIEACKNQRRICEPQQFPISNIHMYEYPELYGKLTRVRCMQPDSELNRRRRPATPTGLKDQENAKKGPANKTPTSSQKNDTITRFFKPLSQNKHLVEDEITDSPATKLLNRITNGFFTPQAQASENVNPNKVDLNGMADITREKPVAQRTLSYSKDNQDDRRRSSSISAEPAHVHRPQVRTPRRSNSVHAIEISNDKVQSEPRMTRRRSLMNMSKKADEEMSTPSQLSVPVERRTGRRSSLQPIAQADVDKEFLSPAQNDSRIIRRRSLSTISTVEASTPKVLKKPSFQAIAEEPVAETSNSNKTNYMEELMEMSPSNSHIICKPKGRRTLYTSDHMDISEVNNENVNPYLGPNSSNMVLASITPQTSGESLTSSEGHTPVPIFSSTRLPSSAGSTSNRRRTLFNVDMDLINQRIDHINDTSKRRSLAALPADVEIGNSRPLAPLQAVAIDAASKEQEKTEPKMRRLFTPNVEVIVTPPKSSKKSRRSSIGSTSSNSTLKRRRTLATPKPTAAVGPNVQKDCDSNNLASASPASSDTANEQSLVRKRISTKRQSLSHTLVHTNMHRDQVLVIHKVGNKSAQR